MAKQGSLNTGPVYALVSAALFGVSPVFAKLVIGKMSPILLAGLLYLGSGVALAPLLIAQKLPVMAAIRGLSRAQKRKLFGAIVSGGILAPLCLTYGIQKGTAFEVSVLLNLESVATTLIAWILFKEHVGRAVWTGKALLVVGGLLISVGPLFASDQPDAAHFSVSSLLILGACAFWGVDNNLTRDIEDLPPTLLATLKGISAGLFNVLLALSLGAGICHAGQVAGAMIIGAASYGISLVLFIRSLRHIGTSRTSTYFAVGPFFGMIFSVLLLGDRPHVYQWTAALIMALGLWSLFKEFHEHSHLHEPRRHAHPHVHDEHHQHGHDGINLTEPHDHDHAHEALEHAHPHYPDIHHRHGHKPI